MQFAVFKYCSITLLILPPLLTTSSKRPHYLSKLKTAIADNDLETVYQLACIAAENGKLSTIQYIGKHKPSILARKNEKGETIGQIAAEHGHPRIAALFLQKWMYDSALNVSDSEKASLLDMFAEKGYLNCVSKMKLFWRNADLKRIGGIAANNGHLGIACKMAMEHGSLYSCQFRDIIQTALEKSQKVDSESLELFGELAMRWDNWNRYPDVIKIAESAKRMDLIKYLAEKVCACFLHKNRKSDDLRIAFQRNLVNQKFLECLEKANGTILGYIGLSEETICHLAAEYGRLDVIRLMTEKDSSMLEKTTRYGMTVVGIAAEQGHADIVRYVLRQYPSSIGQYGSSYYSDIRRMNVSAFYFAIAKNCMDMDTLKYLVEKDSSLLMITNPKNHKTAAHMAAANGNMEILHYLVKKQPSVLSVADIYGNTILHILAENNNMTGKEFEFFVDKGGRILAENCHQKTVGHIAAKVGNVALLQYLIMKEPSILSASDAYGDTILHILAKYNALSKERLAFFVDQGAPIDAQNIANKTVGHILAYNGHTDLLQYLVEKKPSILTIKDENGDTVLHPLARENALSVKSLEFFAEKGASFYLKNKKKENIPLLAAVNGNLEVLRCVVKKEPTVLTGNASVGDQIVQLAIRREYSNILEFIAEEGPTLLADRPGILFKLSNSSEVLRVLRRLKTACVTKITYCDRRHFENEVLRQALEYDYANVFELMGYDENMVIDQGEPLVFTVVRRNRSNLFHYLAENSRTNLTALDREGNNILYIAARCHDLKKMRYILDTLKAPIDIEWRNHQGYTLLHVSVHEALSRVDKAGDLHQFQGEHQNAMDVIKYLVEEKHANVNARGPNNETVLHWATSRAIFDISNYLLNHRADPKL